MYFWVFLLLLSNCLNAYGNTPSGSGGFTRDITPKEKGSGKSIFYRLFSGKRRDKASLQENERGRSKGEASLKETQAAGEGAQQESVRISQSGVTYWPGGDVPYKIRTKEFEKNEVKIIKQAFESIMTRTCIKFQPWRKGDQYYLDVTGDVGRGVCSSYLGRAPLNTYPGGQLLKLGPGCRTLHTVQHETCHALGLQHTFVAPDRDDYITVNEDNILPGVRVWFEKKTWEEYSDFGQGYDYKSVLHYGEWHGADLAKGPSFEIKDRRAVIYDQQLLSEKDIKKLKAIYCSGNLKSDGTPK